MDPETTYAQSRNNLHALEVLEKLEATGELSKGEALALGALRRRAETDRREVGETNATYRGAAQGATFNYADEIGGLLFGPETRQRIRAGNALANYRYPEQYNKGQLAGSAASGALTAPLGGGWLSAARTLPGLIAKSAALGGGWGALYGSGKGHDLPGRIRLGLEHGAAGAAFGAAAPLLTGAGTRGVRAIADTIAGVAGRGNESRARRAIASALQRSNVSGDEAARAVTAAIADGQPEYRLMDAMGFPGQRLASGLVRSQDDAAADIAKFLQRRQLDQPNRVSGFVEDAFGGPQTATQTRDALTDARQAAARTSYGAAGENAEPVDIQGAIQAIDDRLNRAEGNTIAEGSTDAVFKKYRDRLMLAPSADEAARPISEFNRILDVKQDLSDEIQVARKAGQNRRANALGEINDALDAALEEASPLYRQANDGYARDSRIIEAVDEGATMGRPGARHPDTTSRFATMTPEEQQAARAGYRDRLMARIEANSAPTSDVSRPLRSTKAREEAATIATDPDLFANRVAREGEMWETQNRVLGGSRTADNLQDIKNVSTSDAMRILRSMANLQFGDAASHIGAAIGPHVTGRNEATRRRIAEILMSAQARDILAPVERSQAREKMIRRLIEGAIRGPGQEWLGSNMPSPF